MKLFNILHHHQHGVAVYPFFSEAEPSDAEAIAEINKHTEYDGPEYRGEPDEDDVVSIDEPEYFEVLGPYAIPQQKPVFTVRIREHAEHVYQVEADSLEHLKQIYINDENLLGKPISTTVFDSDAAVELPGGRCIDMLKIAELTHWGLDEGRPLCEQTDVSVDTTGTDDWAEVNCVNCLRIRNESQMPVSQLGE